MFVFLVGMNTLTKTGRVTHRDSGELSKNKQVETIGS